MVNSDEHLWGKLLSVEEWKDKLNKHASRSFTDSEISGALSALKEKDVANSTWSKNGQEELYSISCWNNIYFTKDNNN